MRAPRHYVRHWLTACACLCALVVTSRARAETPRMRTTLGGAFSGARDRAARLGRSTPAHRARLRAGRPARGLFRFVAVGPSPSSALAARAANLPRGAGLECRAHCTDGRVTSNRSLDVASRVLAGVAGAAVATGVVLCFAQPSAGERNVVVPVFRLKLSGSRAVASAGWQF